MTPYYMNGLNKLSKYTTQLTLLSLLDYTLIFLGSLMICNSTTNEFFASCSVYFLFMKYGYIMFVWELSNQDEKEIWDLFSYISCQIPSTFEQDGFVPNENSFLCSKHFAENCFWLIWNKAILLHSSNPFVQKLRVFDRKSIKRDPRSLFHPSLTIPR